MGKNVFYIGHFVEKELENDFKASVAGRLKMQYVKETIEKAGFDTQIISLCAKIKKVNTRKYPTHYFWSIPSNNRYIAYLNTKIIALQFIIYLLFRIPKSANIVLYHSYLYTHILKKISKIKQFHTIIEVEEVYGYSASGHRSYLSKELDDLKGFDYAILVNDHLPIELDFLSKQYVVSYGVHILYKPKKPKFNDGKIHAVYAGTLSQSKRGARAAVESAAYLPDSFQVDIFGYDDSGSVKELRRVIDEVNHQSQCEKVRYMGYKSGEELFDELARYDIGLSTNIIEPDFVNNTFPSKTITYMSLGLSVVSGYAEAFDGIELTKKWSFFHEHEPKAIADAICAYSPCTIEENQALLTRIDQNLIDFLKATFHE